jgi:hypothetical protein
MKFIQLFNKIPNHKRFGYTPRHYDPLEEEMKERELRLSQELGKEKKIKKEEETISESDEEGYRKRIAGSFRAAKKTVPVQADPSASMMRLALMLVMVAGFISYLQFGNVALYAVALIVIPVYLYLKFRKIKR